MKGKRRLAAGLLCAVLLVSLAAPASAHGRRGHGHHSGYDWSTQEDISCFPYESCAAFGRHLHRGVTYCGYDYEHGPCPFTEEHCYGHHGCY